MLKYQLTTELKRSLSVSYIVSLQQRIPHGASTHNMEME